MGTMESSPLVLKETVVPNPITLVKTWALEQATAIHSVTRPLPAQASPLR